MIAQAHNFVATTAIVIATSAATIVIVAFAVIAVVIVARTVVGSAVLFFSAQQFPLALGPLS